MTHFTQAPTSPEEDLMVLLDIHADNAMAKSGTNEAYYSQVRDRTEVLQGLIRGNSGLALSVVCAAAPDVKPIAEVAFGRELDDGFDDLEDFSPTAFPGLLGRVRIIGNCSVEGSLVALDFLGAGD